MNFCFEDFEKFIRHEKAALASSQSGIKVHNPFVCSSRTEIDSLTTALDALQILTSRSHQSKIFFSVLFFNLIFSFALLRRLQYKQ